VMMSMLPIAAAQQFAGKNFQVGDKFILSGSYPFYNVYETSDGKWMTLGALEPKFWANFCTVVGRADLIAGQFADGEARAALFAEVTGIFKSHTREEWIERMRHADCCCEPVLSLGEAFEHEQAKARQMVLEVQSATAGIVKQLGFAYKLSDTPPSINSHSPELGEDTGDLLAELGYSEDERKQLETTGVVQG
jgi:alpha-methylacyl-CoA racemase